MIKKTKCHNNYSIFFSQKRHMLQFGSVGFKVLTASRLTKHQINIIFWLIQKNIKEYSKKDSIKLWFLIFPDLHLTKLNLESRMGKGKGNLMMPASFIKAGTVLCEFDNLSLSFAKKLLVYINKKFPGKLKLMYKFMQ